MPIDLPQRRRARLPQAVYAELAAVCSITIAVAGRQRIFADPRLAQMAVESLREQARSVGVTLHAFCVMPDHVHLVVSPSETCNLIAFVGRWKSHLLRRLWHADATGTIWQAGFWDRFLRDSRAMEDAIRYVHDNPVRAGRVDSAERYPFSSAWDGADLAR